MSGDGKDYELHDDQLQYLAEQARRATASDVAVILVRKASTGITARNVPPGPAAQAHVLAEALTALLSSCQTILEQGSRGNARLVLEVDGRRVPLSAGEILHRTVRMTPDDGK